MAHFQWLFWSGYQVNVNKEREKNQLRIILQFKGLMSVFIYIFYIHASSCLPYIKSTHPPISSKKCLFNCFASFVDYRYGENNVSINSLSVKHTERKRGEFTYNYWMATDVLELSSLWKCVLHLWSRCTFHTYSEVNKALHTLLCSRGQMTTFSQGPQFASCAPIPTLVF